MAASPPPGSAPPRDVLGWGRATLVALLVALVVAAVLWWRSDANPLAGLVGGDRCVVTVGDDEVELTPEQAGNAAIVVGRSVERGLPARAASIAIATVYQESDLYNVDYGDRDSLGLFQQRPSQGWGTPEQVMDPLYASDAFYDALVEVDGYADLPIHDAAQEVQRSFDGSLYEQHETNARAIASALTGNSPAALTCEVDEPEGSDQQLLPGGLTRDAETVRRDVVATFGDVPDGGYAPGGVSTGHSEGSAHYDGRAVDFFFRPAGGDQTRRGWALAQYLVANAERLGVATVIFNAEIWTARRSSEGWRDYEIDTGDADAATRDVLLHRDHVHVDVA